MIGKTIRPRDCGPGTFNAAAGKGLPPYSAVADRAFSLAATCNALADCTRIR